MSLRRTLGERNASTVALNGNVPNGGTVAWPSADPVATRLAVGQLTELASLDVHRLARARVSNLKPRAMKSASDLGPSCPELMAEPVAWSESRVGLPAVSGVSLNVTSPCACAAAGNSGRHTRAARRRWRRRTGAD